MLSKDPAPSAAPAPFPRPVAAIPADACRRLSWFFTDIDDTITTDGLLPDASYAALWALHRAGIRVVPVTGRPAGWCDHIARMWPVAGVVGENGALRYSYDRGQRRMRRRYVMPVEEAAANRSRLERIARRVLREVPGTGVAADQPFRLFDYAIDFCEDVPALPLESVDAVCAVLREEGAAYKVSSIHVNYWFGSFDKVGGMKDFLAETAGERFEEAREAMAFSGDSPNDEPMFREVPLSIGVGNIRRFLDRLEHRPAYVTEADSAEGFREAVDGILGKRAGKP
jgi:HAD superfamily hydrolase (TIGR01484 family)